MKAGDSTSCLLALYASTIGLLLGWTPTVCATGFFVNQQSVKGLARVGAGSVAAADELGTIYTNPAGLTEIWDPDGERTRSSVGVHLIVPRQRLRNTGSSVASPGTGGIVAPYVGTNEKNPTDPTPIPNVYWARSLEPGRLAVGAGINFPFGLAAKFSPDWFGRYDAIEAALRTVNLSAVGAYRFDSGLSLGGGLDLQYANSRLVTAVPNPLTPGGPTVATDGRTDTKGQDWQLGFNVGVLYPLSDRTRVGVHYRSGMQHSLHGSTVVSGLSAPLDGFNGRTGTRANLNLPAIAAFGVRHKLSDDLELLGQVDWFDWSRFKEVRIRFSDGSPDAVRTANYRDAYSVAVGAQYRVSGELTLHGGVRVDQTPTVNGFRDATAPDADRLWLGMGASFQRGKSATLDVAFNQVFFRSTNIHLAKSFFSGTPLATTVGIQGRVRSVVNTVSIDYRVSF